MKKNRLQIRGIGIIIALLFPISSFAQKLAIKSNIPYLATGALNVDIEVALSPKLTLDLSYGINPFSFGNNKKWNHWLLQPEVRYWFCERFYGSFLGLHIGASEYNFSGVKIPTINGSNDFRYEGWAAMGGLSYGYSMILGGRWNLETTLGIGAIYTDYKKFECPECGKLLKKRSDTFFAPTKINISIIYMLK